MPPAWLLLGVAALAWGCVRKLKSGRREGRTAKRVRRPAPLESAGADELSVVVWNVLADFYAQHKTYPHCYVDHLDWGHRWVPGGKGMSDWVAAARVERAGCNHQGLPWCDTHTCMCAPQHGAGEQRAQNLKAGQ
jgi:hypothetical protein